MTTYNGATTTSHTSIADSVKIAPGKLIADFQISTKLTIDKAIVNFEMRNPETAVDCNQKRTY